MILDGDTKLGWDDLRVIVAKGMIVEDILLPFTKLRDIRSYSIGMGG